MHFLRPRDCRCPGRVPTPKIHATHRNEFLPQNFSKWDKAHWDSPYVSQHRINNLMTTLSAPGTERA